MPNYVLMLCVKFEVPGFRGSVVQEFERKNIRIKLDFDLLLLVLFFCFDLFGISNLETSEPQTLY